MKNNFSTQTSQVYASMVFGNKIGNIPETPTIKTVKITENKKEIKAVYPHLNKNCIALTMDASRLKIAEYNRWVKEQNKAIEKHNADVFEFKKTELTEVQKAFSNAFKKRYGTFKKYYCSRTETVKEKYVFNHNIDEEIYNSEVDIFCQDYGLLVDKMRLQTIKHNTEVFLVNFLHAFNVQLSKRNAINIKYKITLNCPLPAFELNLTSLVNNERNGEKSLTVSTQTIRRHRNKLIKAGILQGYVFRGHKKSATVEFSPEILTIFDLKTNKYTLADNQAFNSVLKSKCNNIDDNTRPFKDKCKIKENVNNSLNASSGEALTPFVLQEHLQEHPLQVLKNVPQKNALGGAEKFVESEVLQQKIMHPQELAIELANGTYNHYTPIDKCLFWQERNGFLVSEQMRQLIIQDFLKQSAKLWKDKKIYAGVWKKTINYFNENYFLHFTGNSFDKTTLVEMLVEMRWRLNHVMKYCRNNPEFNLLFPFEYFNRTRTLAKEGGFEYTKKAYLKHKKYTETEDVKQKIAQRKAENRKNAINQAKAVETLIKQFLKNKISIEEIHNKITENYPNFIDKWQQMMLKVQNYKQFNT